MEKVHAELGRLQEEREGLQRALQKSEAVKAQLLAVRGKKERSRVNLKLAQDAKVGKWVGLGWGGWVSVFVCVSMLPLF